MQEKYTFNSGITQNAFVLEVYCIFCHKIYQLSLYHKVLMSSDHFLDSK